MYSVPIYNYMTSPQFHLYLPMLIFFFPKRFERAPMSPSSIHTCQMMGYILHLLAVLTRTISMVLFNNFEY